MVKKWMLLVYKIPREPTAGRVFIWRKLKQLGAIALQDATGVLPQTSRTQEQFQWLGDGMLRRKVNNSGGPDAHRSVKGGRSQMRCVRRPGETIDRVSVSTERLCDSPR